MKAHDPRALAAKGTKQILMGLVLAVAVMVPHWTLAAGPAPVDLGSTAHFTILAGAAVTSTGGGIIDGDVGASPIAGSAIGLNAAQVNGIIYAVDASGPAGSVVAPAMLTTAKGDLTTAYNEARDRTPVPTGDFLNPGAGNIGGLNLIPGLYKFTGTAQVTGSDLTLTGGPDDVWIFQIAADLQVGSGIHVILAGGARAKNIFWQVGTSAVLDTFSVFKGTILADQAITMKTSSTMEGRALAFTAGVTFNGVGGSLPPEPQVGIVSPTNGTVYYWPCSVTVQVFAVSANGISSVDVFAGTNRLGTLTNAPYELVWTNPPLASNSYVLTAQAWDTLGQVVTSTRVNIRVKSPLWVDAIAVGGGWKYLPWFGYFQDADGGWGGWIWHAEHGWLFPSGTSPASIWLWSLNMNGSLWTSASNYPLLWSNSLSAWLWYYRGTGNGNGGWFYNYQTGHNEWR